MEAFFESRWGELAALAAAASWALSSVLFRRAGQSVSPLLLNLYKGLIASLLLLAWFFGTQQQGGLLVGWPTAFLLLVSGAIGIGVGDTAFFASLNELGERRTVLIAETMAPPITLVCAFVVLQESLSIFSVIGMLVTILGVAWVVAERSASGAAPQKREPPATIRSCLLAASAAVCQAVGAIMSRQALLETDVGPLGSSLLRLLGGLLVIVIWIPAIGLSFFPQRAERTAWRMIFCATFLGTLLGILLQQTALQYTQAAIAQTLLATSVLFVLPLVSAQGQSISMRAWIGAGIALAGVALLVLCN